MSLLKLKDEIYSSQLNDFIILGCGPSLNDFSEEQLYNICKGKIVIAIKQALFKLPSADIHVINTCNLSDYRTIHKSGVHSIFQIAYPEMPYYDITRYDTVLPIVGVNNFELALTTHKVIQNWKFSNTNLRCWGPGLIYETVFYLCHYLGAKNIYTIGWDISDNNDARPHFYKNSDYKIANKAQPLEPKETQKEIELSRLFYEWLKSEGINLSIASENSYAHSDIPRVKL